jgi:hypothetical protein
MALPINYQRPPQVAEKPPIVQYVSREDVTWNRPIFRAPPLKVSIPSIAASDLSLTAKITSESTGR